MLFAVVVVIVITTMDYRARARGPRSMTNISVGAIVRNGFRTRWQVTHIVKVVIIIITIIIDSLFLRIHTVWSREIIVESPRKDLTPNSVERSSHADTIHVQHPRRITRVRVRVYHSGTECIYTAGMESTNRVDGILNFSYFLRVFTPRSRVYTRRVWKRYCFHSTTTHLRVIEYRCDDGDEINSLLYTNTICKNGLVYSRFLSEIVFRKYDFDNTDFPCTR